MTAAHTPETLAQLAFIARHELAESIEAHATAWRAQVEELSQFQLSREPVRNDPLAALSIRLLVQAGACTQEDADKAFRVACQGLRDEAARQGVEAPYIPMLDVEIWKEVDRLRGELEAARKKYTWLCEQIDHGPLALCEEAHGEPYRWSPIASYCDDFVTAAIKKDTDHA